MATWTYCDHGEGKDMARSIGAFRLIGRRALLTGVVAGLAAPSPGRAQRTERLRRIGFLLPGDPTALSARVEAFRQGLREFGYEEGKSVQIDWQWGGETAGHLLPLAKRLVSANVELIVAVGGIATRAAMNATKTIPIVMAPVGDPVSTGLVESLARPGGNVTGYTIIATDLNGKRLELLRDITAASRVAVLMNLASLQYQIELKETEDAAALLGVQLRPFSVTGADALEAVFEQIALSDIRAIILLTDGIFLGSKRKIVALAARSRTPAVYWTREFPDEGGLASYGANIPAICRQSADYMDKILKGAQPAELPIVRPTKFELVVNMKAATALGLTIPPSLLARADEVIE